MKKFGIRMTLPEGDPMRHSHLLGDAWESYRWYTSQRDRDRALVEMQAKHVHYREGDHPSVVLTKVQQ